MGGGWTRMELRLRLLLMLLPLRRFDQWHRADRLEWTIAGTALTVTAEIQSRRVQHSE